MIDVLFNLTTGLLLIAVVVGSLLWLVSFAARSALKKIEEEKRGVRRCEKCGYDLRATPNGCPECGRVPTEPKIILLNLAKIGARWPRSSRTLRRVGLQETLQPLWLSESMAEAEFFARFLIACGIPPAIKVIQRNASGRQVRIAQVEVWEDDLDRAKELVEMFKAEARTADLSL